DGIVHDLGTLTTCCIGGRHIPGVTCAFPPPAASTTSPVKRPASSPRKLGLLREGCVVFGFGVDQGLQVGYERIDDRRLLGGGSAGEDPHQVELSSYTCPFELQTFLHPFQRFSDRDGTVDQVTDPHPRLVEKPPLLRRQHGGEKFAPFQNVDQVEVFFAQLPGRFLRFSGFFRECP